jgi:hypothetical protein
MRPKLRNHIACLERCLLLFSSSEGINQSFMKGRAYKVTFMHVVIHPNLIKVIITPLGNGQIKDAILLIPKFNEEEY